MGKLFTKQEMKNELLKSHPFSQIEVLSNGSINEPLVIKCLECGSILTFKKAALAKKCY